MKNLIKIKKIEALSFHQKFSLATLDKRKRPRPFDMAMRGVKRLIDPQRGIEWK
jgi:hypothetical protein